jgi:ABC-type lipoprotein export system ATPase subunit
MASIELRELTKYYKQASTTVKAVDGINLSVEAGEFISIVGRSGSGKTTTLDLLQNVMLPLRYTKNGKDGKARAAELLEEVGLQDRMHHRPDQMSGGEKQRVAIARSLINRPSLVLGDEATGEVDSETSQQIVSLMRRMNREHGVTFILVTHDMDVAAQTDRVIRLKDGKVLSDVKANPDQRFMGTLDLQGVIA